MQNVNDAFQVEGHKRYKQRLHVDKEPLAFMHARTLVCACRHVNFK